MCETKHRILFVNSEIFPYLPESPMSLIGRQLPQGIQECRKETRSFMPRFGCINERKNQLHEVIRLSGMNIIIGDVDRPLIIKVASIPSARMQVYFIDNEDYFKRKQIYCDADGKFFEDNDERAIFYARGVLETVKKLRWAPDIIHCHGWISHLVPAFLKKAYKDDPIFSSCKVVLSLYNDDSPMAVPSGFRSKVSFGALGEADLPFLEKADGTGLAKTAIQYTDGVILGSGGIDESLVRMCRAAAVPVLDFDAKAMENGEYIERYNAFYDSL